jgi:hypothetical protein
MNTNEDLVGKFVKQAKTEIKVTPPVSSRKNRILVGLLIGVVSGTSYALMAETINFIQLPGIPLYFHPFGTIGNILYAVFLGGLTGVASAWGQKALYGMEAGGLIIFIGIDSMLIFTAFSLFALLAIAFEISALILFVGLIRWAVDVQLEKPHLKIWNPQRVLPILLLIGIAVFVGYLHKLPREESLVIKQIYHLVQRGLKAQEYSQLPDSLKGEYVGDFLAYGSSNYKLENNDFLTSIFHNTYPELEIRNSDRVVVVYFESGQDLACLAITGGGPICILISQQNNFPILSN